MHPVGFSGPLGSKTPPHGPKTPPNHDFGTILEVFWTDLERIFGIILEVFFMKKRCFTCMGAHFSKVSPYFVVSFLLAGISDIAVLPAWELIFREFA